MGCLTCALWEEVKNEEFFVVATTFHGRSPAKVFDAV